LRPRLAFKAVAAEPAEEFLSAVSGEEQADDEAQDE
jgi:hypothetical protein